jgi:hypothetical protein
VAALFEEIQQRCNQMCSCVESGPSLFLLQEHRLGSLVAQIVQNDRLWRRGELSLWLFSMTIPSLGVVSELVGLGCCHHRLFEYCVESGEAIQRELFRMEW